ncbi:NAD(P)-binding domain-containing protein [Spirillospora sp. CA-294931]|uniref:NAD(P)-binding domain-containing protein n=1 Tax=Spirillospora sp. CA-294931 TaxID=3240042 RepID=UPI003D8B3FDD
MNQPVIDTLIVGAGPYGLSVAAHALGHGLETRLIGTPMEFWQNNMPSGMFLKSEPFASNLSTPRPGGGFTDQHDGWPMGRPIPLETFVAYGRWFAEEVVGNAEPVQAENVRRDGDGYAVTLSTGEIVRTRTVVMAIGVRDFAHTPPELLGLPGELVSHSVRHREFGRFAGRDVAVVGAGQSALETAALLAEEGARPVLVARRSELAWNSVPELDPSLAGRALRGPQSGLGRGWRTWLWSEHPGSTRMLPDRTRRRIVRTTMGPAGAWWLRDRLDDRVELRLGHRVTGANEKGDRVELVTVDATGAAGELRVDHVIAATGFVPDLDRIAALDAGLRARVKARHRSPVLNPYFESSEPGLYFTGLTSAASFGPVMRFVHGSGFAARRIAGHLSRHRDGRTTSPAAEMANRI